MKRIVLTCGLIAGVIVSTIMAISMVTCYNRPDVALGNGSMVVGYLSMLVAFSLIYVGVKNYRDKQQQGLISFGKAFRIGLYITLIASTLYVITWAIVYHYFLPGFMDIYTEKTLKQIANTASPAELKAKADEMADYKEMYKNPFFFALFTYAEILPVGLLVSLITAAILKRKNRKEKIAMA